MFVPITSEVTIGTGLVLKEIATGQLFEVGSKLKDVAETWEIKEIAPDHLSRIELVADRQTLSRKYWAEVND
jgi:hypothetical protein